MKRDPALVRDLLALGRWFSLLKRLKPDLVVIGTPKAGLLGLVASLIARVPVRVYQLRGLRLETTSGAERWILWAAEKITAACASHILAVSPSLASEYSRHRLARPEKIKVLGLGSSHGVDIARFQKDRWACWTPQTKPGQGQPILRGPAIGFVGRFSRDKGSREILWCHNALLADGIEHLLWIVGPIEETDADSKTFDSRSIVTTGRVEDTAPYYSLFDVLVLPTHREGFPNVVLEAAAAGIPTVTTNATGARDSVRSGETGLIVPTDDPQALTAEVKRLLTDHSLRLRLGQEARAWVSESFDAFQITQLNFNFLSEVYTDQKLR